MLKEPNVKGIMKAHISGLLFGYSLLMRFVFVGYVFWIAAKMIDKFSLDVQ